MAGAHTIDIEQLVKSMTFQQEHHWSSRNECGESRIRGPLIYRTNGSFRSKHKNAYEPIMFSIGPYNHGTPRTHAMQVTKYEFLELILNLNHRKTLPDYLEAMGQMEKQAKSCYNDEINLSRGNFVKMLLLDGCFVLMSLIGTEWYTPDQHEHENSMLIQDISSHNLNSNSVLNENHGPDEEKLETIQSDIVLENACPLEQLYSLDLWHGVLLLENQIPFFVISKLYELVGGSSTTTAILTEKMAEFVENSLHCYPKAIQKHNRPKEFFHLLHLCHLYFRPCIAAAESYENQPNPSQSNTLAFHDGHQVTQQAIPSRRATEYHQAGIHITKRKYSAEDPHSLLDIVFCNGILEIPGFTIDPNTQSLFCNLLAFEQTCPQFGNHFTTYITFFCGLIRMPDDVSLLTKSGIIVHQLNSDGEVCDLFRMIMECAVSVSISGFNGGNYLKPLCNKIETRYQNRKTVLREFLTSITSKVHGWSQESESSESLMSTSEEVPV